MACVRQTVCVWLHGNMVSFQDRKRTDERRPSQGEKVTLAIKESGFTGKTPCSHSFSETEGAARSHRKEAPRFPAVYW